MANVETTPTKNNPCAAEKTRTMRAPEQGRKPTDKMAAQAERNVKGLSNVDGSAAWPPAHPHSASWL